MINNSGSCSVCEVKDGEIVVELPPELYRIQSLSGQTLLWVTSLETPPILEWFMLQLIEFGPQLKKNQ